MDQTLKQIIDLLKEKTQAGEVKWIPGRSTNEYKVFLTEAVISISVYNTKNNDACVSCSISNNRGDILLRENTLQSTEDGKYLSGFFALVRDSYTGKDAILSSVFQELRSGKTIGEEEIDLPF